MKPLDWRNPNDYEFTKSLTMDRWKWEFLRRNSEYVAEYEAARIAYINDSTHQPFRIINPDTHRPFAIDYEGARNKWGFLLDEIYDPKKDNPNPITPNEPIFSDYDADYRSLFSNADRDEEIDFLSILSDSEVTFIFDLKHSIKEQIDICKSKLETAQATYKEGISDNTNYKNRRRLDYWTDYLRTLDAVNAGADANEIATHIFKGISEPRKSALRAIKISQKLSSGGYRRYL